MWIIWKHFCLGESFWCHLPILQPLVHVMYFLELRTCDKKIKKNLRFYQNKKETFGSCEVDQLENATKEINSMGKINYKNQNAKKTLLAKFMDMKLLEGFLEAGPQLVFQIMVVMQDGFTTNNQRVTILTSALSLMWTSAEIYLKYPTEVVKF